VTIEEENFLRLACGGRLWGGSLFKALENRRSGSGMIIRRCRMRLWNLESLTNKSMPCGSFRPEKEHTIRGSICNPSHNDYIDLFPFLAFSKAVGLRSLFLCCWL